MIIGIRVIRALGGFLLQSARDTSHSCGAAVAGKVPLTEEFNEVVRAVALDGAAVADATSLGIGGDGSASEAGVDNLAEGSQGCGASLEGVREDISCGGFYEEELTCADGVRT